MKQKIVFACLYVGYLLNVYVKRSVTFALPEIAKSEGMDKSQLGLILSGQMLAYTVFKFVSGILLDFLSPKILLSISLISVGASAYLFASVQSSVWAFTCIWILNGVACSPGWPASALIMKKWFRSDQFGTAWSMLSTSMNVAGTLGPLATAFITTHSGWRASLYGPGSLAILFGASLMFTLKDTPDGQDCKKTDKPSEKEKQQSDGAVSRKDLFKLPGYTGVCITYSITSVVQFGCLQWGPVYLVNDLGHSIITGNSYISSVEVGGICGSVIAGYYSDYLLSKRQGQAQVIRQYVIAWFTCGLVGFLYMLTYCVTRWSSMIWINIIGFGIGMCIYGPISIFGVTAMECAPGKMAGTAHAVTCLFANFGQTLAGLPLSYVAKFWGWQTTFLLLMLLVTQMAAYLFLYTTYNRKQAPTREKDD